MEMSNPKGQHLESAFPLPWGFSCFSWAIHTPICTSLYLHICVYSGACGAESRQSKGALGQALCQRPAAALVPQDLWPRQTGPCFCRWRTQIHVTETSQNWLRKLVKDWTQQLSSKECGASDRATSPDHCLLPPRGICTWPRRACLVKAPVRRSLRALLRAAVTATKAVPVQEGAGHSDLSQQCRERKPCADSSLLLQLPQSLHG